MLYSEFIEGTGCKDSVASHDLYVLVNTFYLDKDCSKNYCYSVVKNFKAQYDSGFTKEEFNDLYEQLCLAYTMIRITQSTIKTARENEYFEYLLDINMKLRTKLAEPGKYGNEL